jgi:glycerate 2-kinase
MVRPLADGGEGTLDAFVVAEGGRVRDIDVTSPLGGRILAPLAALEDGGAVVEMATASGLHLVTERDQDPALRASSRGTGELILEAIKVASTHVIVGIGGSASSDGGTGAAIALGWRFLDAEGRELPPGGGELTRLHALDGSHVRRVDIPVVGACDVDNPLTGARGAAQVFGPQKGADPDQVAQLARGLERLAEVVQAQLGIDIAVLPYGGSGGGMGAGLAAFFGAELRSGFELLTERTDLEERVREADLVITGEGRLDSQSLRGKAPIALSRLAARHRKPCVAVAGDLELERGPLKKNGIEAAVGLAQTGGDERAKTDPEGAIEIAIEGLLRHRLDKTRGVALGRRSRL